MFHQSEGVALGKILDGTSSTIAIVSVIPKKAVIWTQPIDWNVNLDNPKADLFDAEHKEAVIARADSSPEVLSSDVPAKQLKGLLTKDGGEVP